MTISDLIFLILVPSFALILLGLCISHHRDCWEKMTEEEKAEDYELGLW